MAYHLKQRGVKAVYYHGQLDLFERNNNATTWLEGRSDVMCVTNAFCMGIDKRDVRFVIQCPSQMRSIFKKLGELEGMGVHHLASCYSGSRIEESSLSTSVKLKMMLTNEMQKNGWMR